ncbi:hypothetical protein B6S12_10505, partial [Helicobacter valdiviensis]
MGSDRENAKEWWYFADGWNNNKGDIRNIDEFRLVGDIDFQGNKGVGEVGKDWQNYADFGIDLDGNGTIDTDEYTSMIVGDRNSFTANFDGQGYTLKNINIDTTITRNYKPRYVGIFGNTGGVFKNINVDYIGGSVTVDIGNNSRIFAGGFAGGAGGTFFNITLNNINNISSQGNNNFNNEGYYIGGFAGGTQGNFFNIVLNNINNINSPKGTESHAGGFTGHARGTYTNITLNNIKNISSHQDAGGFAGWIEDEKFSNITLNNIENIDGSSVGGFVGAASGGIHENIILNNIGNLSGYSVGGFIGYINVESTFKNIYIHFKDKATITAKGDGATAGKFLGATSDYYYQEVVELSNINLYYADGSQIAEIKDDIGFAGDGDIIKGTIDSHPYSNEQDGFTIFKKDVENFFKEENNKPQIHYNKEGGYYTFLDETNNGNGG